MQRAHKPLCRGFRLDCRRLAHQRALSTRPFRTRYCRTPRESEVAVPCALFSQNIAASPHVAARVVRRERPRSRRSLRKASERRRVFEPRNRCALAKSQNANEGVGGGQDRSILITTAELEADRQRCQKLASDSQMDHESTRSPSGRPRRGLSCNQRRPRAGHYPMHFSPYRVTDKALRSRRAS